MSYQLFVYQNELSINFSSKILTKLLNDMLTEIVKSETERHT